MSCIDFKGEGNTCWLKLEIKRANNWLKQDNKLKDYQTEFASRIRRAKELISDLICSETV